MHTLQHQLHNEGVESELITVIETLVAACKTIARSVNRGALDDIHGVVDTENVQGEVQKKLDVIANDLLKQALLENPSVAALASEEESDVVAAYEDGRYVVAFDPLDGSSNIDINGQIGTIFTVYRARADVPVHSDLQFRQLGSQQVCAGYVLYGAATLLMITTGSATQCFTLDVTNGEFLLTIPAVKISSDTQEFAVNMANQRFWFVPFKRYVEDLIAGEVGPRGKRFNMRWNAAMVGDVHRVLIRGGIFCYPSDARNSQQPAKLRLLYEANPMALLVERAGGKAYTESERILDVIPSALHQRVPVIIGSAGEVDACLAYLK